jgi:sec-independent protein translocase protein TatC
VSPPSQEDEAALEATKAPLMEHLVELRRRLIYALLGFAVCFVICFYFAPVIFNFLVRPLHVTTNHLIYTSLTEVFFTYVQIGVFGGLCLGFPWIAGQIWAFVAPGLYRHEKRAFLPFLLWTPLLFITGAAFVYYVMMPFSIQFFGSYQTPSNGSQMGIQLEAKVSDYLGYVMMLIFAFGLTFQLPVLLSLLAKVGLISAKTLREMRKFAIVGLFALAAAITPPDWFSMMCLAVPLVALYEISILCVVMIERDKAKQDAARAAAP